MSKETDHSLHIQCRSSSSALRFPHRPPNIFFLQLCKPCPGTPGSQLSVTRPWTPANCRSTSEAFLTCFRVGVVGVDASPRGSPPLFKPCCELPDAQLIKFRESKDGGSPLRLEKPIRMFPGAHERFGKEKNQKSTSQPQLFLPWGVLVLGVIIRHPTPNRHSTHPGRPRSFHHPSLKAILVVADPLAASHFRPSHRSRLSHARSSFPVTRLFSFIFSPRFPSQVRLHYRPFSQNWSWHPNPWDDPIPKTRLSPAIIVVSRKHNRPLCSQPQRFGNSGDSAPTRPHLTSSHPRPTPSYHYPPTLPRPTQVKADQDPISRS